MNVFSGSFRILCWPCDWPLHICLWLTCLAIWLPFWSLSTGQGRAFRGVIYGPKLAIAVLPINHVRPYWRQFLAIWMAKRRILVFNPTTWDANPYHTIQIFLVAIAIVLAILGLWLVYCMRPEGRSFLSRGIKAAFLAAPEFLGCGELATPLLTVRPVGVYFTPTDLQPSWGCTPPPLYSTCI